MKIIVQEKDHNIRLRFPTGLAMNRVTALTLPRILKKYGITITRKQAITFIKALNSYRHQHRDWNLVEVESAQGEHIRIKL